MGGSAWRKRRSLLLHTGIHPSLGFSFPRTYFPLTISLRSTAKCFFLLEMFLFNRASPRFAFLNAAVNFFRPLLPSAAPLASPAEAARASPADAKRALYRRAAKRRDSASGFANKDAHSRAGSSLKTARRRARSLARSAPELGFARCPRFARRSALRRF